MDDSQRGFGLSQGGYYFAISEMMDAKVLGEIFTKGSWALGVESNYNKRYKYSGLLQANYQVTKTGDKNMPDYMVSKDFKVIWSHRQDAKASPNSTFSASVNFTTSSYEKQNLGNYYNPQLNSQNTKTSSISYSRSFPDQKLTISSTFNIAQTLRDSTVSLTLPDLNISLSNIFPFKKKNRIGSEKWYEKISLRYTGRMTNSIVTKDDNLFGANLIKEWTNGMSHNIPISATFTLFDHFNITPSINYREWWYTKKVNQELDETNNFVPTDTVYGFHRLYDYSMSLQVSTKLYGMYKPLFAKKKEIEIRHVFTPSVSVSATPDFADPSYGFYRDVHYTENGEDKVKRYSPYDTNSFRAPLGMPSTGKQGLISFSVSNNVEMKYKSDKDSTGRKKISLIDELGFNISYNTAAKTNQWSDLRMQLRLKLSKSYTLNLNTSFATYAYQFDKNGNVYVGDRTEWSYGRFGRFSGWNTSFNYTFNNDTFKKWFGPKDGKEADKDKDKNKNQQGENPEDETEVEEKQVIKAEAGADGYQAFKMPWSLNFNYGVTISEDRSKEIDKKSMRYPYKLTHNLNFSGNVKLTNKWNVNFNSGYDFEAKKIVQTTFTITRDLHCFTMSASLSPFGQWKSYNFRIAASASILQDLKWEQRSQTQSNVAFY